MKDIIPDMIGNLYVPKEMPEPPKQGFLKGLFSGGPSVLDREELCNYDYHRKEMCRLMLSLFSPSSVGEASSGKGSKVVAMRIPGSQAALDHAKIQSGSLASELAKARMVSGHGLRVANPHAEVLAREECQDSFERGESCCELEITRTMNTPLRENGDLFIMNSFLRSLIICCLVREIIFQSISRETQETS